MKKILLFFFTIAIVSCNTITENKLIGVWKLTKVEDPKLSKLGEMINSNFSNSMEQITNNIFGNSYLNFYSENDYCYKQGSIYVTGKWSINKDKNILILTTIENNKEQKLCYSIDEFDGENIKLKYDASIEKGNIKESDSAIFGSDFTEYLKNANFTLEYKKEDYEYNDKKDDIYSFENNSWRIKPLKPESTSEIKERLKASINYLIVYLNSIKIREEKTINTNDIISPIKIASNGIGLKKEIEIPSEWVNIFFDKTQASEAYTMLENAFKQDIKINKKKEWIDFDIDLLKQISTKL